jgi:hypothetical protein
MPSAPALCVAGAQGVQHALTTLVNPQLKQHMDYWEGELAKRVVRRQRVHRRRHQMSFPLEAQRRGGLVGPKAMAFLERIHARRPSARAGKGAVCDRALTASRLHRRDYLHHGRALYIAGRIDAVAETNDHEAL